MQGIQFLPTQCQCTDKEKEKNRQQSIYLWGNNGGWSMMSLKALILYQCDRWVHAETSGVESKHILSFISDNSTVIREMIP